MLLVLAFVFSVNANAHNNDILACIDDHPPYQVLGDPPSGIHITALHKLATLLDLNLTFLQSPNFARCVALLKRGDVDVIAALNPLPERQDFAFFAPFKPADALRVISKDGIQISTYNDFQDKIIGVSRGVRYFSRFDNDESLQKIDIQNVRIGFSLLLKNRIDLIMVSPAMINSFSKEIKEADLKVSPIALEEMRNKETFFGFSKLHKLEMKEADIKQKIYDAYQSGYFAHQNGN
ncbi:substrate-binding periplasmic protein [Pseudoalteromonas sp.]|uniref:substrate-binding periplasmic protein n=1 Tax=Pseudoalteromonas sp. TaxID=53249 RepID=UPI003566260C